MRYVIIIEMEANELRAQRFTAKLDALIINATQSGGIDALSSVELEGHDAAVLLSKLANVIVEDEDGPRQ